MTGQSITNKVVLRSLQFFMASVLLLTGIGKLLDVPGFVQVLIAYQTVPD